MPGMRVEGVRAEVVLFQFTYKSLIFVWSEDTANLLASNKAVNHDLVYFL